MTWSGLHNAPRKGEAIWLFLPAASWTTDANGRPSDVKHAIVVASWDAMQSAWINRATGHAVYPSLWNAADVDGAVPDSPMVA
jgi:hypothetical protein